MLRVWIAVMFLVACKRESAPTEPPPTAAATPTPGTPVAPGTLKRSKTETAYVVAAAEGADLAALEKLARGRGPGLTVTRGAVRDVVNAEQLAFMMKRLAGADADALNTSPGAIVLRASGADALNVARTAAGAAADVAEAAHGWVIDPVTLQIFSATEFRTDEVPADRPDIRKLIMVHGIGGSGELPFLETVGLSRYGFPELYVAEAAPGQITEVMHLVNAAAQILVDGGDVDARGELTVDFEKLGWKVDIVEGGTGRATWKLRWANVRDAGDDHDLVVELVPPSGPGTEGVERLLDACFGALPDIVSTTEADDPELLAAGERARADLAKLRAHFAKGIPLGEDLSVKAKFSNDEGQVEWMWVEVVAVKRDTFSGTLANTPEWIETLRNGQKVTVKLADVADYLHDKADGSHAGGYSIEIAKQRGLIPADREP